MIADSVGEFAYETRQWISAAYERSAERSDAAEPVKSVGLCSWMANVGPMTEVVSDT